jgi:hypothetical protein
MEKDHELGLIWESTKDSEKDWMELDAEVVTKEFIQKDLPGRYSNYRKGYDLWW